jgi:hypothetical protein
LTAEIGNEVEFAWMTENFFLTGQIKSEELGKAFKIYKFYTDIQGDSLDKA